MKINFRELGEKKRTIDLVLTLYGHEADVGRDLSNFYRVVKEKYTREEMRDPSFEEREVPQEVMAAFRPLYEILREERRRRGEELPPL